MSTPTVQRNQRKAKSKRVCGLCLEAILPGMEYIHHKIRLNEQCVHKYTEGSYHIHCDAIMDAYLADGGDNAYDSEEVEIWLRGKAQCAACETMEINGCNSPFGCAYAVQEVLSASLRSAAIESIRAIEGVSP